MELEPEPGQRIVGGASRSSFVFNWH